MKFKYLKARGLQLVAWLLSKAITLMASLFFLLFWQQHGGETTLLISRKLDLLLYLWRRFATV